MSFNAAPSSVLSGADNATLSHFFDTAPSGHAIYYSYYPEPEQFIASGQFSAADYRAAWAHIVSLAAAAHNPYLHSTLVLTNWDLNPASGRNWKDYLPGGGVISTLGWDAYPAGTVQDRNPQPTPPAQFMGPAVAASRSVGLPFGFAEFALGTPTDRPAWLAEVANYLSSVGALFGTLFNSPGYPWTQLTDAASISAWRTVVAKSGLDTPVTQPVSTPTPTPTATPAPAGLAVTAVGVTPLDVRAHRFQSRQDHLHAQPERRCHHLRSGWPGIGSAANCPACSRGRPGHDLVLRSQLSRSPAACGPLPGPGRSEQLPTAAPPPRRWRPSLPRDESGPSRRHRRDGPLSTGPRATGQARGATSA